MFWVTPRTLDYYNVVSNRLGNVPGMMFDSKFKYENMENRVHQEIGKNKVGRVRIFCLPSLSFWDERG